MSDGYGTISYLRFLIYLIVSTLSFYLVWKYLDGMNSLESSVYKKKAKRELYVFFLYASIIIGSTLFFYVKNEYSEIRKKTLKKEITAVKVELDKMEEELQDPFKEFGGTTSYLTKDTLDEYGISIKNLGREIMK